MLLTLALLAACPWFKAAPLVEFSALTEYGSCAGLIVMARDPAGEAMPRVEFTDAPLATTEEEGLDHLERRYELPAGIAGARDEAGDIVGNGVCTDVCHVGLREPEAWVAVAGSLILVLDISSGDPSVAEPRAEAALTLEDLLFESETGEETLWLDARGIEAPVYGLPG